VTLQNWMLIEYSFENEVFSDLAVDRAMSDGRPFFYKYVRGDSGYIEVILYPNDCVATRHFIGYLRREISEAYQTEKRLVLIFHTQCTEVVNIALSESIRRNLGTPVTFSSEEYIDHIFDCADPRPAPHAFTIKLRKYSLVKVTQMVEAKDIMVPNPKTIFNTTSVDKAYDMMLDENVGHYPVTNEEGKLLGIVSDTDLLPFTSPVNKIYNNELRRIKAQLAGHTSVSEVMVYLEPDDKDRRIVNNVIYENEEPVEFLRKFFRPRRPALNLLMVLDNETDKQLKGVISWVNVLQNWGRIVPQSLHEEFTRLTAIDVAYKFDRDFPTARDDKLSAAAILEDRESDIVHRHFRLMKEDKLVAVYHFHELLPYQPIPNYKGIHAREMRREWWNLWLDKLSPLYSLDDRFIPADMLVWNIENGNDVISKFLRHVVGKRQSWHTRLAGLLISSRGEKEESTHLLNPYDIIGYLVGKLSKR